MADLWMKKGTTKTGGIPPTQSTYLVIKNHLPKSHWDSMNKLVQKTRGIPSTQSTYREIKNQLPKSYCIGSL